MLRAALELLRKEYPLNIRLMGLRMSNLLQDGVSSIALPPSQTTLGHFFGGKGAEGRVGGDGDVMRAGVERVRTGKDAFVQVSEEAVEMLCGLGCGTPPGVLYV